MTGDLAGRSAYVTGGTRGIGAAIARRLTTCGASVTVTGTSSDGPAPAGCGYRAVDFADRAATEAFASELAEAGPGVLVNNAGINRIAPFAEIEPEDFDRIQAVNVRAPFLLSQAVLPGMRSAGWGRIVNIGSVFGTVSRAERGAYSTSKFAIDGMTAALAAEVARDGVLVNTVSPGFVVTDLTRSILGEAGMAESAAEVPLGRFAEPDEIAVVVAWMCSVENTYISGQNIVVDGGLSRV